MSSLVESKEIYRVRQTKTAHTACDFAVRACAQALRLAGPAVKSDIAALYQDAKTLAAELRRMPEMSPATIAGDVGTGSSGLPPVQKELIEAEAAFRAVDVFAEKYASMRGIIGLKHGGELDEPMRQRWRKLGDRAASLRDRAFNLAVDKRVTESNEMRRTTTMRRSEAAVRLVARGGDVREAVQMLRRHPAPRRAATTIGEAGERGMPRWHFPDEDKVNRFVAVAKSHGANCTVDRDRGGYVVTLQGGSLSTSQASQLAAPLIGTPVD